MTENLDIWDRLFDADLLGMRVVNAILRAVHVLDAILKNPRLPTEMRHDMQQLRDALPTRDAASTDRAVKWAKALDESAAQRHESMRALARVELTLMRDAPLDKQSKDYLLGMCQRAREGDEDPARLKRSKGRQPTMENLVRSVETAVAVYAHVRKGATVASAVERVEGEQGRLDSGSGGTVHTAYYAHLPALSHAVGRSHPDWLIAALQAIHLTGESL